MAFLQWVLLAAGVLKFLWPYLTKFWEWLHPQTTEHAALFGTEPMDLSSPQAMGEDARRRIAKAREHAPPGFKLGLKFLGHRLERANARIWDELHKTGHVPQAAAAYGASDPPDDDGLAAEPPPVPPGHD